MRKSFQFPVFSFQTVLIGLVMLFGLAVFMMPTLKVQAVDVINPVCNNPNVQNLPVDQRPTVCKDQYLTPQGDPILGPNGIVATIVNLLSLVGGLVAVVAMIVGGVKLIVSSGDSSGVASARRTILYAIVSLGIIAMAQLIVRFIISKV